MLLVIVKVILVFKGNNLSSGYENGGLKLNYTC